MKNIGIFYGSSTGSTEHVANLLASKLSIDKSNVYDVANTDPSKMNAYDIILFGSSTLGYGDLQDDWEDFIDSVKGADLSGKKVAIFGLGDSCSYSDTFCDSIGTIFEVAEEVGASLIGNKVDIAGYSFDESKSVVNGYFCGLPIDEDNESEQTENRIDSWVSQLLLEI